MFCLSVRKQSVENCNQELPDNKIYAIYFFRKFFDPDRYPERHNNLVTCARKFHQTPFLCLSNLARPTGENL